MAEMEIKEPKVAKHQRFRVSRILRTQIKNAPYNPRKIDNYAKKKLQENLKRVGLLEPLVVNEVTGHLVSGHQRLAILDSMEESKDYFLDVAFIQLSEKEEREQMVFMNNQSAMGTWDVDLLDKLIKDEEANFNWRLAGFDQIDIEEMIPSLSHSFDLNQAPIEIQDHIGEVAQFAKEAKAATKAEKQIEKAIKEAPPAEQLSGEDPDIQEFKKIREDYKQKRAEKDDSEYYLVVVFPNRDQKEEFLRQSKLDPNDRYVDGVRLASILGLNIVLG